MPEFVTIARTGEVPEGEGRSFEVGGRRIAVFNVGGEYHAIDDVCVHRGGPLGDGSLEGSVVTCPWHGWRYDVLTGRCPDNEEVGVPRYTVVVEGDEIRVEI